MPPVVDPTPAMAAVPAAGDVHRRIRCPWATVVSDPPIAPGVDAGPVDAAALALGAACGGRDGVRLGFLRGRRLLRGGLRLALPELRAGGLGRPLRPGRRGPGPGQRLRPAARCHVRAGRHLRRAGRLPPPPGGTECAPGGCAGRRRAAGPDLRRQRRLPAGPGAELRRDGLPAGLLRGPLRPGHRLPERVLLRRRDLPAEAPARAGLRRLRAVRLRCLCRRRLLQQRLHRALLGVQPAGGGGAVFGRAGGAGPGGECAAQDRAPAAATAPATGRAAAACTPRGRRARPRRASVRRRFRAGTATGAGACGAPASTAQCGAFACAAGTCANSLRGNDRLRAGVRLQRHHLRRGGPGPLLEARRGSGRDGHRLVGQRVQWHLSGGAQPARASDAGRPAPAVSPTRAAARFTGADQQGIVLASMPAPAAAHRGADAVGLVPRHRGRHAAAAAS